MGAPGLARRCPAPARRHRPVFLYGLRSVELRRPPASGRGRLPLARLAVPGRILLFALPRPPWAFTAALPDQQLRRLLRAGAVVTDSASGRTRIDWPGKSLRDFVLLDVLPHELAHHAAQHHGGKRSLRTARSRDHELRAVVAGGSLRARLNATVVNAR